MSDLTKEQKEIFCITQEECAEVTQAISKIFRFGIDGYHASRTNIERLEEETGDLLAMIDIMMDKGIVNPDNIKIALEAKKEKLKTWSSIKL